MKYLVSVKDTLTSDELARLRQTAAFPLKVDPPGDGTKAAVARRKPHQLYEPVQAMRDLGLPVLEWGEGKWKANSEEGEAFPRVARHGDRILMSCHSKDALQPWPASFSAG